MKLEKGNWSPIERFQMLCRQIASIFHIFVNRGQMTGLP